MENLEAMEPRNGLLVDAGSLLPDTNNKGDQSLLADTTSCDKFIEEMESYWEDINSRLTVSRMVSDAVIKGIVNAVMGEAAERVSLKEAEIATLGKRLQHYESAFSKENRLNMSGLNPGEPIVIVQPQRLMCVEGSFHELSNELRFAAQEHLRRLREELRNIRVTLSLDTSKLLASNVEFLMIPAQESMSETLHTVDESVKVLEEAVEAIHQQMDNMCFSSKASVSVQRHEDKIQREVSALTFQKLISELHGEIETKAREQKVCFDTFNKDWQKTVDELSTLREELDVISTSLSSELGLVHHNLENSEEWNNAKKKEHSHWKVLTQTPHSEETGNMLMEKTGEVSNSMVTDSPQLKSMKKDELISYFKNEMSKMKRQHDSALQEKTEELFILKREFLKEKGTNPLHFRRDKDIELRKKIIEIISKLDGVLIKKKETSALQNQQEILHSLKQKIDNLYLQSSSTLKYKDVACASSQISNGNQTSNHSQIEECLLQQSKVLGLQESRSMEGIIKDKIESIVLTRLFDEIKYDMEESEFECKIVEDTCFLILKECMQDAVSSMNLFVVKNCINKDPIAAALSEKENTLFMEMEENKNLRQEKESLFTLLEDKEKLMLETEFMLIQEKERNSSLCHELNILQNTVNKQALSISEHKRKSDSMKDKLVEMSGQIKEYQAKLSETNQKLEVASDALMEAEKQQNILRSIMEEKQMTLESTSLKEEGHVKEMKSIINTMMQLLKNMLQFETTLSSRLVLHESRLNSISHHCSQTMQQANFLKRKAYWYKQGFEQRCSDLQKAENEVDLLGDEVDTLLRLLEKIYIVLEHYYPVLQHYPGVVEILKLIRREMRKEAVELK